jgi:hypothetical protein
MAEEKAVAYAKAIQIILLPITVVIGVFYLLYQYFIGPVKAVADLWKQQYQDYVEELKRYSEEDQGNLTPEHLEILNKKTAMIQQTEATYISITNDLYGLAKTAMAIAFTMLGMYILPDIVKKWKGVVGDKAGTAKGMSYIAICSIIDDYAAKGQTLLASRLAAVTSTYFNTVDMPFMQAEIARYQQLLPTLTGWQYLYALFIIQYYTIELMAIPAWFAALTPLPPP